MKLRAVYLVGLTLLLNKFTALRAQSDSTQNVPNPTVVNMLRVTLDFLATDKKAFGNVPEPVCKPCNTYEELTAFAQKNRLRGADDLINDTRKQAQQAIEGGKIDMPKTVQNFLMIRIINGKEYRKQLPTFATFQQNLRAIATSQTPQTVALPAAVDDAEQLSLDTLPETAHAPTDTYQSETITKPFSFMEYIWNSPIPALILSLISLIGVAILWNRGRSTDELTDLMQRVRSLESQNREFTKELKELKRGNATAQNVVRQPPAQTQQTQSRPQPVQTPIPTPEPEPIAPVADIPPITPVQSTPPASTGNTFRQAPASTPTLLYGRTADLGDGFSISGLSNKPDRDTVFEIQRQTDTLALFQVSDQPDLQRLALSDPYSYLNDTCSYQTQPRPGSRIRTEKPGKLSLQGDKWAIIEKAQISFIS